jgi:hypothetical protein
MALFATRRDLDAWARCLGVDNDDDATAKLTTLAAKAGTVAEVLTAVCRSLNGIRTFDAVTDLRRASARMDNAYAAMGEALRGFYVHERGR